ncbi:uncharacterized protein DUF3750 [Roseibium hamelinense]|uniref:Uncharacterized protein DUF3750 n=1 Tax=Roseibium hamelinense TaxID=150831 RepID=A0A562TJ99_9HYPH|nr:DUF3750 domain-containing protein [Roseibium hamelinense]MTI42612.1 DUF3750 domain-containing protein [Roseibium hamelinense]TWI93358.1 uncharacterized protein DUF3750 [Roseibium hamelinense]
MRRIVIISAVFLLFNLGLGLTAFVFGSHSSAAHWSTANRDPVGIAPDPSIEKQAIIQVYAARAFSWRGYFGVHSWISIKEADAPHFTTYEVTGWRVRYGGNAVSASRRAPDSRWFGSDPQLLADFRGDSAHAAIPRLLNAIQEYQYNNKYTVWPGPNSNTFIAHLGRIVPELKLDLPPTAIGKDYLQTGLWAKAPSGTGYQFSVSGLAGVLVAVEEGIELNLLGLTYGLDIKDVSLKLPMIGRLDLLPSRVPAT